MDVMLQNSSLNSGKIWEIKKVDFRLLVSYIMHKGYAQDNECECLSHMVNIGGYTQQVVELFFQPLD